MSPSYACDFGDAAVGVKANEAVVAYRGMLVVLKA